MSVSEVHDKPTRSREEGPGCLLPYLHPGSLLFRDGAPRLLGSSEVPCMYRLFSAEYQSLRSESEVQSSFSSR